MLLEVGKLYRHKAGAVYRIAMLGLKVRVPNVFKRDQPEWFPAVMYRNVNTGEPYVRTVEDFQAHFALYEPSNK